MWIASARYSLVLVFNYAWVHDCLFQIPVKSNTRDDYGLIYVEQPNCHILGMEVEYVLCLPLSASQLTGTSPYSLIQK